MGVVKLDIKGSAKGVKYTGIEGGGLRNRVEMLPILYISPASTYE